MANFEIGYPITSGHEGGYANNKLDTGGETYAGISRVWNPDWPGWKIVDAAKKQTSDVDQIDAILARNEDLQADIAKFYKQNYWDVNRLDALTNQAIANKLYDVGVNMGVGRASRMLQEALNLTNNNGRSYPDMVIDGIVGPKTVTYTNSHPRPGLLLGVLKALQGERYLNIMRNNPPQEAFAASWFSRV
ncbi:putative peptidoglycan-binding domain-containing protein [Spirosoma horti]